MGLSMLICPRECFCGNSLNLSPGDSGNALQPGFSLAETASCTGNPWEFCGTFQYQIVYTLRETPMISTDISNPFMPLGDANYNFSSVYTDLNNTGLFIDLWTGGPWMPGSMSVELCLFACADAGSPFPYTYAGLENGE
jgi:hypothetical protein